MGPRASTPDTGATAWSALAGEFVAERERWFLWLPVLLGTGIALYFGLRIEPPSWTGGAWLAFATLFLIAARHRPAWRIVAIVAIAGGLGFAMAQWRSHDVAAPVLTGEIGPATTSGRIVEVQAREHGVRLHLRSRDHFGPRRGRHARARANHHSHRARRCARW